MAFGMVRSTYQYHCKKVNQVDTKDNELKHKVRQIYNDSRGSAGSRKVSGMLKQQGEPVGRHKARSVMGSLGLVSKQQKKHRYRMAEQESVIAPNHLAREFAVDRPNQVWCGIWIGSGWLYLAVVLDSL